MVKIKVYELAKELSLDSKDIILKLKKMGYEVRSHMSSLDDSVADKIRMQKDNILSKSEPKVERPGGFVPKVTRIPKAVINEQNEKEQNTEPEEISPESTGIKIKESENIIQEKTQENAKISEELSSEDVKITKENESKMQPQRTEQNIQSNTPTPRTTLSTTPVNNSGTGNMKEKVNSSERKPKTEKEAAQSSFKPRQSVRENQAAGDSKTGRGYQQQNKQNKQNEASVNDKNKKPFIQKNNFKDQTKHTPSTEKPVFNKKPVKAKEKDAAEILAPAKLNVAAPKDKNKKYTGRQDYDNNFKGYKNKKKFNDKYGDRPGKGYKGKGRKEEKKEMPPVVPKKVVIGENVVLGELAKSIGKTAAEVIKKLFAMGIMATINQEIDSDTAILIADEFKVTVEVRTDRTAEIMEDLDDDEDMLVERPPVVTVMGHVDHGKTSLLDAIRKTNVIATEAGGITQHIGAYQVEINGKKITFLDTPGHEAFTAMRARGAQITDIVIIVVAADDGVMPQTIEAINHSKAAGVPIIVAINKIDKPGANQDRVKQELTEHSLLPEDWGGDTIMVPVSAKQGTGIENLLEMILLVSEVAELKANPDRQARGTVVEAKLDKARGPVATLLVQKGTLNHGDSILAGAVFGKVKAMNDDKGRKVKDAGPSFPVEVLGFSDVPPAGEVFLAVKDDKDARLVAYKQQLKKREDELHKSSKVSLDDLFKQISEGEIKELNLILKADVQGSIEALAQALNKLNTDEVKVKIIHSGVGGINDTDVMLASASNAIIIGFNVRPDVNARKSAEQEHVDIRLYRVIYDATDDVKKAMSGLLEPDVKEVVIGHAEVRAVFKVPKAGMVAGSYITDGKITRNALVRVIRDSVVVAEGTIESLRRFKDDAKEVQTGFECGIGITNFNDIKENDVIEAYIMEEIKREL